VSTPIAAEQFGPLSGLPWLFHAFSLRTSADTRAETYEAQVAASFGYRQFARADQPHGNGVAVVGPEALATTPAADPATSQVLPYSGVDALVTNRPGVLLLIRCADCAPVYLVDPGTRAIGLVHSGRKGTLANVVGQTVALLQRQFGTDPGRLRAYVGPSIGPCHYDMDLWTPIEHQLRAAGVRDLHLPRRCTACHLDCYYSYRAEKGQTGRHFALLALR
jgi:copper oxidase (laccase) domain-containing protein